MVKEQTRELNTSLKELEAKNTQMENELNIAHQMQLGIVPYFWYLPTKTG